MQNVKIAKIMKDNNIDWYFHTGDLWARDKANMMIIVTGWSLNTVNNWIKGRA